MLQEVRQRGLRRLVLAGYLLAVGLSGFAHEHTHAPSLSPTASAAPAKPRCTHHCCHHHHHAPPRTAGHDGHSCPHDVPGHCPDECDACQFLGQCPLPVTLATVEVVEFSRPLAPPALRALCTALVSNVHPARGPPEA